MIKIINLINKKQEFFQNYHDFCEYINKTERFKTLESGKKRWRFSRRKHETLSFVYDRIPRSFEEVFTPQEKEAFEKGLELIEIFKGDEKNPEQILFTTHLDIESLKRDWCRDYCLEHGYEISEWEEKKLNHPKARMMH